MSCKNSIVQYIGPSQSSSCGYCKKKGRKSNLGANDDEDSDECSTEETAYNFGIWGHQLSVVDYVDLLDRGWRRSGQYLYKPVMEKTCCPQYTIRLDIERFRLSRTQKRVLKTMLEFLKSDKRPTRRVVEEDADTCGISARTEEQRGTAKKQAERSSRVDGKIGPEGEKPFPKKKTLRRQRATERLQRKGIDVEQYKAVRRSKEEARRRTLESFINLDSTDNWAHKLEIRLLQQGTPEFDATIEESFGVYQKYQQAVHSDKDCTRRGYESFLVSSPLYSVDDERTPTLGSYHQQYVLDGRIVAVGIIDILPRCLSSKYFYYDPEYRFLTLGTYSALRHATAWPEKNVTTAPAFREIAFTRELSKTRPDLKYYYMGYYLQNCPKMRYKGKFRPSELLCDKTFQWMPLEECVNMILENGGNFTVFRPDDPEPPRAPVDDVRCMVKDTVMTFRELKQMVPNAANLTAKLEEYTRYAGPLAHRMILYL